MKRTIALLDFVEYSVNDKIVLYKNIAIQLADTLLFPNLEVPIETINAVVADFEAAILAAKDGAHSAIAIRNDKEQIADDLFRVLLNYVNKVANGNETTIIKSGFHASKQPTPYIKPEIDAIDGGHSGSIIVVLKAVLGAVAYKVRYRKSTVLGVISEWIEVDISTITRILIDNLTPGVSYDIQSASISKAGTSDFCNPITKIVI